MVLHYVKRILLISLTLALPSATAAQLLDGLGDPLPQRAVARLGSSRLRHGGQIGRVMFSPDGRKLASWGGVYQVSEGIAIWEAATGKKLRRVVQPGAWLDAWAWTPDGRLFAVLKSREGKKHSLFDFNTAKVEGQALPERDDGDDNRFAVSPSGKVLAVSSHGRDGRGYTVEFRELSPDRPARDAKVLGVARGNLDYATVLRFTPDGQKLIVFTPPNRPQRTQCTAVVWDVETVRELGRMNLTDKAFGPGQTVDLSNERIAAVLPIGTVRLYDLITREEERLAEADEPLDLDDARTAGGAVAVRFSLDGSTLVTAGPGQRVRFWNMRATGKRSVRLRWAATGSRRWTCRKMEKSWPWADATESSDCWIRPRARRSVPNRGISRGFSPWPYRRTVTSPRRPGSIVAYASGTWYRRRSCG